MNDKDLSRLEEEAWERGYTYAAARIKQLEAALRDIAKGSPTPIMTANAALDNLCEDEGCPNAGTPHVCINRVRQENDDVFKGFRGNNEA